MGRRIFCFALPLFFIALLFVSCSDKADDMLVDLDINISVDEPRGMMLGSEVPDRESIIWTYKLTKHDKGMTWGEGDEALLNGTLKVSQGVWWADIWGYRDSGCREVVYAGGGEGAVGPEGGVLRVSVSTVTDPSLANSLDPSKEPKNTAELILGNLVSEKDVQLDKAKYLDWKVDGKEVASWSVKAEGETFGNIQGHLYSNGVLVTEDTEIVVEIPAGIHDIQAVLTDERGGVLSSMLWEDKVLEMNCVHRISGVMPVQYLDYLDFYDIKFSWDDVADDQIVVGFAYDVYDNQPKIENNPIPVYVDELKDEYTTDELNFRCFTIESGEDITGNVQGIWIGKNAILGYHDIVDRVRFDPSATSIKYRQMNLCQSVDEVVIHEGIRDIQYYGISAENNTEIELSASLDYLDSYALSNKSYGKIIFKNPEGWMIGGELIDSEILSDPVSAAALYDEKKGSFLYRVQDERDCVAVIQSDIWIESSLSSPLENYSCYQTQLEGTTYSNASFKIVFLNDGDHTIYIRHDSPCEEDYIKVSELNSSTEFYKCSTASFGNSLASYDAITYEGVKAGDYCNVMFKTNGILGEHGEGYVLVQDKVKVV